MPAQNFKRLALAFDSGWVDYPYSYRLDIDEQAYAVWQASGAADTRSKVWRLPEGVVDELCEWTADLKVQPADDDQMVIDAPCIRLTVQFRDGTVFKGVHYPPVPEDPPAWVGLASMIEEAAGVDELVRPMWKRLADQARHLSDADRARLITRLREQPDLPAFLKRA
ncbi:hypothetical protein MyNCGM152_40880 [Achromobacter xylosoxidans]